MGALIYLDILDECLQTLHLPVGPSRNTQLPTPLLQQSETDVEFFRRSCDRHVEIPTNLFEGQRRQSFFRPCHTDRRYRRRRSDLLNLDVGTAAATSTITHCPDVSVKHGRQNIV